jgi:hypothetical protein
MAEENLKGLVDGIKVPTQTLIQTLSLRFSHLSLSLNQSCGFWGIDCSSSVRFIYTLLNGVV